jgi:hypothetical protein
VIQDGTEAESCRWNLQGEIQGKSSRQKDCCGFQHGVHVVDSVTLCSVRQLVVVQSIHFLMLRNEVPGLIYIFEAIGVLCALGALTFEYCGRHIQASG